MTGAAGRARRLRAAGRHTVGACLLAWLLGCGGSPTPAPPVLQVDTTAVARGPVKTGAKRLVEGGFAELAGRRVGLIVNHTARVDTAHLADLLSEAPNVELAVLFGPEHGLRGTADAGEAVAGGRDARTGVPLHSLYGAVRKPTPEMLRDVDVLVFDIQDVGARFYTYISTMGMAMQAAAEAGIPFVVLDRPNPLGGEYVAGFVLEPAFTSFVGQYPIPVAHGLTVGELARMIQGEKLLPGLEALDLRVVAMEAWTRNMLWQDTGLPWISPSPNIPDAETAFVYPGTCFFEAVAASEGRGTREPFRLVGALWADGQALAERLNAAGLPGVRFEPARFTPRSIPGMSAHPRLEGESLAGVRLSVTNVAAYRPVETGIYVLDAFYRQASANEDFVNRPEWLAKLAGTERLGSLLADGARPEAIVAAWADEVAAFRARRAKYLLY